MWAPVIREAAAASSAGVDAQPDQPAMPMAVPLGEERQQQRQPPTLGQVADRAQRDAAVLHARLLAVRSGILDKQPSIKSKDAEAFFKDLKRNEDNKHQMKGECMACGKSVSSTASHRLVQHLIKCPLLPAEVKSDFKRIKQDAHNKSCGKRQAEMVAEEEAEVWWAKKHQAAQAVLKQQGIKTSMMGAEAAWADKCIADFFYANAIPFSVASCEPGGLFRRMISAIKATPASYKPPNFNQLGNELLESCYQGMWQSIKSRDPDGSLALKYGATYVCDGWDSCDNLSLINSAFISNNDGGIFWRSVDTSGKVKDAGYTASLMIKDIYDFGPTKVVLVITDTCAVMQKAWDIVMQEFPWISCLPCQPHVVSLLLKDIGKTPEVR